MVLVKINTPVHYHVKKNRIFKNKICQGPVSFFDGNMVVSAGMAHYNLYPSVGPRPYLFPSKFIQLFPGNLVLYHIIYPDICNLLANTLNEV